MMQLPIKIIELDFVIVEFYESYMISTFIEGIVLPDAGVYKIQELAAQFYGENSFGYISNRINDYARNLSPDSYNRQAPNLFAIAVVYKTETTLQIANFEKFFIKVPFKTFKSLNEAKAWMDEQGEIIKIKKAGL